MNLDNVSVLYIVGVLVAGRRLVSVGQSNDDDGQEDNSDLNTMVITVTKYLTAITTKTMCCYLHCVG